MLFRSKWKRVTSRERQATQEHFIDLCHLVSHQTPNDYDPSGTRFAFEMGAGKTSGGQGWADVAKLTYFGWEYKGRDHDLDKATPNCCSIATRCKIRLPWLFQTSTTLSSAPITPTCRRAPSR